MMKQDYISIFEIFKIGIGPSSSHTMGPWRAAQKFIQEIIKEFDGENYRVKVTLYGSLAATGLGHQTDKAVIFGLMNLPIDMVDPSELENHYLRVAETCSLSHGGLMISINPLTDIEYNHLETKNHPNEMMFELFDSSRELLLHKTYQSLGGGRIRDCSSVEESHSTRIRAPYVFHNSQELKDLMISEKLSIPKLIKCNEVSQVSESELNKYLCRIWNCMEDSIIGGLNQVGYLPGSLKVSRRARAILMKVLNIEDVSSIKSLDMLKRLIMSNDRSYSETTSLISAFAMAVNEENASMGRVVTSPTNGSAGVIPASLMYLLIFERDFGIESIKDFLLTASCIGHLFIQSSTISAAVGGCQAEIGVSSAMAAAGIAYVKGGTSAQVFNAAEIAMEHHLGLTCDPIQGLVQVPCIERNALGAMKALTAANIALSCNPDNALVSLDDVIQTMYNTALDMSEKYKETSRAGLAISVSHIGC